MAGVSLTRSVTQAAVIRSGTAMPERDSLSSNPGVYAAYYTKAAEVFKQIQKQGMGSYDTDYNLVVLYQSMEKYEEASAVLKEMLEEYGENYRTYKALAFMEVSKQEKVDVNQRSYGLFKEYYEKAEKLYQQQLENNVNDLEMKRLKELYDQAASNGWFSN